MRPPLCLLVLAIAALAACGKSDSGSKLPVVKPVPSKNCSAAAQTLAGFPIAPDPEAPDGTPPPEKVALVAEIQLECETLGLTDDEAQCLADARDKLAALKCPRALTKELREIETEIGVGPCRPVMLVTHLAEIAQMRQVPPDQRDGALKMFKVVKRTLGKSCRADNWGAEAMECFATRDVMQAFGCIEMVPPQILEKLDGDIKREMMAEAQAREGAGTIAATGIAACDAYLMARAAFDKCEAIPPSTRKTLLSVLEPLEKPWRSLPAVALAGTGETFAPLCEQAFTQLGALASSVGCP